MGKYQVYWSVDDDMGQCPVEVEAESEREARDKIRNQTIAVISVPAHLQGGHIRLFCEVESVELLEEPTAP